MSSSSNGSRACVSTTTACDPRSSAQRSRSRMRSRCYDHASAWLVRAAANSTQHCAVRGVLLALTRRDSNGPRRAPARRTIYII